MSSAPSSTAPHSRYTVKHKLRKSSRRRRFFQILILGMLILVIVVAWQLLNSYNKGSNQIKQITNYPMTTPPTRLLLAKTGETLYGLSDQDLWSSFDGGSSWAHRWHFNRGDLISLVLDPQNPYTLYAGFFLPPEVIFSKDGRSYRQTLTD